MADRGGRRKNLFFLVRALIVRTERDFRFIGMSMLEATQRPAQLL